MNAVRNFERIEADRLRGFAMDRHRSLRFSDREENK